MPKYPGIHSKILKSGTVKYYGSKWKGKTYTTSLYPTAQEAYEALQVLIKELQSGIRLDKKHITVEQFIRLYIKKYIEPKQILEAAHLCWNASGQPVVFDGHLEEMEKGGAL